MVELVTLFWIFLSLAVLIFAGRFLANSVHILLYILLVLLVAVFFFNISISDVVEALKKLVVTYW